MNRALRSTVGIFWISACLLVLTQIVYADVPSLQWSQISDLPAEQSAATAQVINNYVYIAGGQNSAGQPVKNMRIYDPNTDSWSDGPLMMTARYWAGSGVIEYQGNKELYVVGGFSGSAGYSIVRKYVDNDWTTPGDGTWQLAASVSGNRGYGIMCAVVDNTLYAIGGHYNGNVYFDTNQMYNRSTNSWITKSPIPVQMTGGLTAVYDGKIYIFGGWNNLQYYDTTLIYDPATDSWSYGSNIPHRRSYGNAVCFGEYIYLIANTAEESNTNLIDVYHPASDTWSVTDDYPGLNWKSPVIAQDDNNMYVLGTDYNDPAALECRVGQIVTPEVPPEEPAEDPVDVVEEPSEIEVVLEIKPEAEPKSESRQTPFNTKSHGVLPAVILGTESFDVNNIDPNSITLEGVAPLRWNIEDVSAPVSASVVKEEDGDCDRERSDGIDDLILKFDAQEIEQVIESVNDGDIIEVTLTGLLLDGTPITGKDSIQIIEKEKGKGKGKDGKDVKDKTARKLHKTVASAVPDEFSLGNNYPNPFNPVTTITFSLPSSSSVTLKIYNMLGEAVETLAENTFPAGYHSVDWNASGYSSGLYFYRIEADNFSATKKLMLTK